MIEEIAVLLTCHNRREKTLACLETLFDQELPPGCKLRVYLTDDGSTDGTVAAVLQRFHAIRHLAGDGSLFWNGGMRLAFEEALKGNHDFYLWLNDDTLLDLGAVESLLWAYAEVSGGVGAGAIVVGTTRSPRDGRPTYGGVVRRSSLRRTRFSLLEPGDEPLECETMNGNCVLIPRQVAKRLGTLDSTFVHGMGDFDYGLRARATGFQIWVMPGYAGTCDKNPQTGTFHDHSLPLAGRWRLMHSPKGLPTKEWRVFCRRHAGPLWFLFFIWPYLRVVFQGLRLTYFEQNRKMGGE
ncbi:MAG: glycosyltransferase family 2 protein [Desulfuromonadales bacterium]